MIPQSLFGKEARISWQATFKTMTNLALKFGPFFHEIASLSGEEFDGLIAFVSGR